MKYYLSRSNSCYYFCHPSKRPFKGALWTDDHNNILRTNLSVMRLYYKEALKGSEPDPQNKYSKMKYYIKKNGNGSHFLDNYARSKYNTWTNHKDNIFVSDLKSIRIKYKQLSLKIGREKIVPVINL